MDPNAGKARLEDAENKPVKNRNEFEKLKKALESIEVVWNHAPGHNGIEGNEGADRLARQGIEGRALFISESEEDADNPSGPLKTIVDVPPLSIDSDENSSDEEFDMETFKRDLKKNILSIREIWRGRDGSTPFPITEEEEGTDTNKIPTRRGLDPRPRRLQRSETSEKTTVGSTPFSSSFIYVAIPYIDPPSPPSLEEKPEVQKPLLNCTEVHNIKLESTEPLTYRRDNYAHFISEDCDPSNAIAKLLVATERLDLLNTWESRPKKGQVLVPSHGKHKTYSVVVKKRHFDEIDWKDVTQGLKNLQLALRRDKQTTLRIANSGESLGSLPQNKMTDILSEIFRGGDITVTLCHGKIQVPTPKMRPKIIEEYHSSLIGGHKGISKTYRRNRERYTWPGLKDQITEFIRGCKSCFEQKLVRVRTREPMLITDTPDEPFDKASLDTVGKLPTTPNGDRHILTMQDNFSKYCIAVPIPNLKTTTIAHAFATTLFSHYRAPRAILTDRGGSFVSKLMRELEGLFNVKQLTTSGYRPQTNGSLEKSHIVLTDYIKHYASDYDDWDRLLPFAMFACNTSFHEATIFTPYELLFGRLARTLSSFPQGEELETYGSYLRDLIIRLSEIQKIAARNLVRAKQRSKEFYDRKFRPLKTKIGDQVYAIKGVRERKFDSRKEGPFTIVGSTENNNVILEDKSGDIINIYIHINITPIKGTSPWINPGDLCPTSHTRTMTNDNKISQVTSWKPVPFYYYFWQQVPC